MNTTPTQQELNVRFAKSQGWIYCDSGIQIGRIWQPTHWVNSNNATEVAHEPPNYFTPENFHLVREAVETLNIVEKQKWYIELRFLLNSLYGETHFEIAISAFLSPVEHIITAYLKVKEAN